MRKHITFAIIVFLLILVSCNGDKDKIVIGGFIGGTEGISLEFQNLRKEVYDVDDQFDVVVKLENKGEYDVDKSNVKVELSGIKPSDFGLREEDVEKQPQENIIAKHKDQSGNIVQGSPVVIEFNNIEYLPQVTGAQLEFPIKAQACYLYRTTAVSKYCVRSDLVKPSEDGVCMLTEDKPVQNSGAPVQVQTLKQTTRGSDKVSFSFDVVHSGKGSVFKQDSKCLDERKNMDKVFVSIDVGKDGLSCTGLDTLTDKGAEGTKTLHDGKATITCTLDFQKKELRDYEAPITIKTDYYYSDSIQDTIIVKSSGQTP